MTELEMFDREIDRLLTVKFGYIPGDLPDYDYVGAFKAGKSPTEVVLDLSKEFEE